MKTTTGMIGLAILAGLLAAPGGVARAQASLDVQCNSAGGQPLKKVELFLQLLPGGRPAGLKSDGKGQARFKNLLPGYYRLWGRADGYQPLYREFLKLEEAAAESVSLNFEAGDSSQLLYFEDQAGLQRADQLHSEGAQALQDQQIDVAAEKLRAAGDLNPSNPDTLQYLGIALIRQKNWDEAEASLRKTAELLEMYGTLGSPEQRSQTEERRKSLDQLIGEIPTLRLEAGAEKAMQDEEYERAVELFRQLVDSNPSDGAYHYNLALACLRSNRLEEARKSADRALEISPDDKNTLKLSQLVDDYRSNAEAARARERVELIHRLRDDGKPEQALAEAQAAAAEFSGQAQAALVLETARLQVALGQTDEAIANYRDAVTRMQDKPAVEKELAGVYEKAEQYAAAADSLRRYYQRSGENPDENLFREAGESVRRGNKAFATVLYENIIQANPDFAEAFFQLGMQRYFENRYDEATKLLGEYQKIGTDPANLENVEAVLVVISRARR